MQARWLSQWFRPLLLLLIGGAVLLMSDAGEAGAFGSLFDGSIALQLQTKDAEGNAVPAATIWCIYDSTANENPPDYMPRLLQRFAAQADYVHTNNLTNVLVGYSNAAGVFEYSNKAGWLKTKKMRAYFAVIKRGYKPLLLTEDVPRGKTHHITAVLERDPAEKFEPRLLEFDLLRAMPNASAANAEQIMQADRRQTALSAAQRMRELAKDFEQEGKRELASMVYNNLAYLPSVDSMQTDHGEVIIGYTNGYDDRVPQRKADWLKAVELSQSNPNLEIERFFRTIVDDKRTTFQLSPDEKLALIKGMEKIIAGSTQGIFPLNRGGLPYWYKDLKIFDEACASLKRDFAYEPVDYLKDRDAVAREIAKAANQVGLLDFKCAFDG